jgi:class 3 adenylate cyclase
MDTQGQALTSVEELLSFLRASNHFLFVREAPDGSWEALKPHPLPFKDYFLNIATYGDQLEHDGLMPQSGPKVTLELLEQLGPLLADDTHELRRRSTWPIERAFVYLDVSDFSKFASGHQLLVVASLVKLLDEENWNYGDGKWARQDLEAQLCIGDGYVYVFKDAEKATVFAGYLAQLIEQGVASNIIPEFHFRIGVHVGKARCFWDPGRKDWNYVGDGINGGSRVVAVIGKEMDDVVFVSAEVRQKIMAKATGRDAYLEPGEAC